MPHSQPSGVFNAQTCVLRASWTRWYSGNYPEDRALGFRVLNVVGPPGSLDVVSDSEFRYSDSLYQVSPPQALGNVPPTLANIDPEHLAVHGLGSSEASIGC